MPWLMNPRQFFRMFSFLFFFTLLMVLQFWLCFFSCLFFLFPGSYLTSSFSLLSPFIQFISKVDKTGRCNGNGNGKIKGGIISVVGNAFSMF